MAKNKQRAVDFSILTGRIFIVNGLIPTGLTKISNFQPVASAMQGNEVMIGERAMPLPIFAFPFPEFFLVCAILFDIVLSSMIIVGYKTRLAGYLLAVYCLAATLIFHSDMSIPRNAMTLVQNFTFVGGLLMIGAFGAGNWSVDGWLKSRK